jgi:dehydrogenase, PQQ-dependent, s-GDH family
MISGFLLIFTALSFAPARADEARMLPTAEPFEGRVLLEGLESPWAMIWGPNGRLWISERQGRRIIEVDPANGVKTVLATIGEVKTGPQHEGLLGLALAPDFERSGWLYVNYTYMDGQVERHKVARLKYDPQTKKLGPPETILAGIPAGDDHQGGRLIFGPDGMLYLSKGELGHNQGANRCKPNEAQRLPTMGEMATKDWAAYVGKVLRMTPEGGIPGDNPVFEDIKSHIFTLGHRNPQGLVFVDDILYEVEHGPSTDDELNILVPGGNYGWPYVAGFKDDQSYAFIDWSKIGDCRKMAADVYLPEDKPRMRESDFQAPDFREPAKTFYTVPNGYSFKDAKFGDQAYLGYATIAPSSVDYYPADGPIKAWRNSLLISALKNGAVYRAPLSEDRQQAQGDLIKYFHTANRYRQVLVAPDGRSIYVITDNSGNALDENGLPTQTMKNPGALLVFEYQGE